MIIIACSLVSICIKIRFINSVESLDQNFAWKNIEIVRKNYLENKYNGSFCNYLVPNKNIQENIELFLNFTNAPSSNLQMNLTKDVINCGAKMFLHLNSCPSTARKKNFYSNFFGQVFKRNLFEPTNSGMILYTLNAMKLFSNDGRIIASTILEKISKLFRLSYIPSQKSHSTINMSTISNKYMISS